MLLTLSSARITKRRQFIKEGKSPAPDDDRDGVCGQSEDHLGSVGQISPAQLRGFGTLIVEEGSGPGHKPRREGILVEFLKYRIFSSCRAKFSFFKRSADDTVGITDRVTIHGTFSDITVIFGMTFHGIFKTDLSISVAHHQVIILVGFEWIIPGVTSTPLESLFHLTLKDTSLSRIFPIRKYLKEIMVMIAKGVLLGIFIFVYFRDNSGENYIFVN